MSIVGIPVGDCRNFIVVCSESKIISWELFSALKDVIRLNTSPGMWEKWALFLFSCLNGFESASCMYLSSASAWSSVLKPCCCSSLCLKWSNFINTEWKELEYHLLMKEIFWMNRILYLRHSLGDLYSLSQQRPAERETPKNKQPHLPWESPQLEVLTFNFSILCFSLLSKGKSTTLLGLLFCRKKWDRYLALEGREGQES